MSHSIQPNGENLVYSWDLPTVPVCFGAAMKQRTVLCVLGFSACAVAGCSDYNFSPKGDGEGGGDETTDVTDDGDDGGDDGH